MSDALRIAVLVVVLDATDIPDPDILERPPGEHVQMFEVVRRGVQSTLVVAAVSDSLLSLQAVIHF